MRRAVSTRQRRAAPEMTRPPRGTDAVRRVLRVSLLLVAAACLAACASKKTLPGDDAPTLASLSQRTVVVDRERRVPSDETQAIAAYRKFLDGTPDKSMAPQRAEAMRRLGDLEMDVADNRSATSAQGAAPDYTAAVARYQGYLKAHPNDAGNDSVLYQLARAQEQSGQLEQADHAVAHAAQCLRRAFDAEAELDATI